MFKKKKEPLDRIVIREISIAVGRKMADRYIQTGRSMSYDHAHLLKIYTNINNDIIKSSFTGIDSIEVSKKFPEIGSRIVLKMLVKSGNIITLEYIL